MEINYEIRVAGIVSGETVQFGLERGMVRGVGEIRREYDTNLSGRLVRSVTGRLLRSVFAEVEPQPGLGVTGRVGSTDFRARLFETGTRPHEIAGRPLVFFDDGQGPFFRPRVQHPGLAARRPLQNAYDAGAALLKAAIEEEIQVAVDGGRGQ